MLKIISERNLDRDLELYICFRDWQKEFDSINWTKLMHILKETSNDGREIKLISKHGSECYSTPVPRGEKKCEDCRESWTTILFVTDSAQRTDRVLYQGIS